MRPNLRSGYMHAQGKNRGAPGGGRVQRRFSHASGMWKDVKGHAVNASGSSLHLSADVPREMDTSEQLQHIFRYYCTFGRTGGDGTVRPEVVLSPSFFIFIHAWHTNSVQHRKCFL